MPCSRLFLGFHPPFVRCSELCRVPFVMPGMLFVIFFGSSLCSFLGTHNSQNSGLRVLFACFFLLSPHCPRSFHQVSVPLNSVTRKARCSLRALWISVCFSITSSTSPVPATSPSPLPSPLSTSSSSFSAIFICDFCVFAEVQDGLGRRSCLQLVPALRIVFIKSNSILCEFYFCCIH